MLEEKDLVLIGRVVEDVFDRKFESVMEHQILPHFEEIHKELFWIKSQMVTKGFLEERMERFRLDFGLTYKPL